MQSLLHIVAFLTSAQELLRTLDRTKLMVVHNMLVCPAQDTQIVFPMVGSLLAVCPVLLLRKGIRGAPHRGILLFSRKVLCSDSDTLEQIGSWNISQRWVPRLVGVPSHRHSKTLAVFTIDTYSFFSQKLVQPAFFPATSARQKHAFQTAVAIKWNVEIGDKLYKFATIASHDYTVNAPTALPFPPF
mmetsp:Transcript_17246/g.40598  ORF Transcript_17246/g.40598 Transcript_17246/m.40598 type:complete len:187 (+) Transcript_17246:1090-1650(+)